MKIRDIVKLMIKEAEEESPEDNPEGVPSNVTIILNRFKILTPVLKDLLSDNSGDIENLVTNIEIIVYKPTTFKILLKNGNNFNLKYNPGPTDTSPENRANFKAKDFFQFQMGGKKYDLVNRSQYLQALDCIATALKTGPVTKKSDDTGEETPDEGGIAGSNIDKTLDKGNEKES